MQPVDDKLAYELRYGGYTGNPNAVLANKIISCYLPVFPESLFISRFEKNLNPIKDQGHPTTIFGRISVRKTILDLEFSKR